MSKLNTLRDLLVHELSDIYSAEEQILEALPKMIKAAGADKLRAAFEDHLEVTKKHVKRLDKCFSELGAKPSGETCAAMKGLITETGKLLKEKESANPHVFDAALAGAAQRVEHYEMAAYGCARSFCDTLGEEKVGKLLQETLYEEGESNKLLSILAISELNPAAHSKRKSASATSGS